MPGFLEGTAGTLNVFERPPSIIRLDIHRTRRLDDHVNFETFPDRIERRKADTVVLSQSADPDSLDALLPQRFGQICAAESRVTVLVRRFRLADDFNGGRKLQTRVKCSSGSALDAMGRPGSSALPEADVSRGMPVS